MQKKILATVLASGFTGIVHSATSVTLYGIVDAGVGYEQTQINQGDSWSKKRSIGLINGVMAGNRWGLKGTEDLGNGTSAIFQLEGGFDMGNGRSNMGGRLFGRQTYVGLTSASWGTLKLGRLPNLAGDMVGLLNPFGVTYKQAGVLQGAFGSSTYARMDNAVKYVTPDFSGFKFGIGYAGTNSKTIERDELSDFAERDTSNWISLGAIYDSGPVTIAASFDRFRTDFSTSNTEIKGTTHMWNLFGNYDFDVVKLYLGYGQVRGSMSNAVIVEKGAGSTGLNSALNDFTTAAHPAGLNYAQTNGYRQQAWVAGLSIPVGDEGKILFSYQGSSTMNNDEGFDGVKGKLSILSLGYTHKLSKRTSLYALASYGMGKLKFDSVENVKLKSTLVGVGMDHRF